MAGHVSLEAIKTGLVHLEDLLALNCLMDYQIAQEQESARKTERERSK